MIDKSGPFSASALITFTLFALFLMVNVSCVVNAHKEGNLIHATLQSVKNAFAYALECGLTVELHVVLDRPDTGTEQIVRREVSEIGRIHVVDYGDLAHSRNYAASVCEGNYVTFIDGDDLWCQAWIVDSFIAAEKLPVRTILHPEFNLYFGSHSSHVFQHVDMDSPDFDFESLVKMNFWTALSFARKQTYLDFPYVKNDITYGFGYEDWTWNYLTVKNGFTHKVVPGTAHYIRKGKSRESLLELSNRMNVIPRIMELYENNETNSDSTQRVA